MRMGDKVKILADQAMPNALETFSAFGEVYLKQGREITTDDLKDIDALMIRSVTKVNHNLLEKAPKLKFIGTATAGYDHIDVKEVEKRGIKWTAAPGNNAQSVGDYVLSVLLVLAQRFDLNLKNLSLGIVGLGHTGSAVLQRASPLFSKIVMRDPPLNRQGVENVATSLEEILACDIVTLHVPLIKEGEDCTYHLLGKEELLKLKSHQGILINASRGDVVDNEALLEVLQEDSSFRVWLDVFEQEPALKVPQLLPLLQGATAHIAGYSLDSKYKATFMLAKSFAKEFNLPFKNTLVVPQAELENLDLKVKTLDLDLISRLVFSIYDVRRDSNLFKNRFVDGKSFDLLRKNYRERRELSTLTLHGIEDQNLRKVFEQLSFKVA